MNREDEEIQRIVAAVGAKALPVEAADADVDDEDPWVVQYRWLLIGLILALLAYVLLAPLVW